MPDESLAKNPKLEKMGSNLMESLPSGVRAFLFSQVSDNLQELWRSGGLEKGTGGDGKRVLGICCKRQRSVLVHDAEKDTQMRGIKFRSFQSALCVPIFAQDKSLIGTVLLIHDNPETFSNEHKFSVERAARDYGPTLEAMRRVTETAAESEETEPGSNLFFSPAVLGSLALALMFLAIWLFSPPKKETPEPAVTVQPESIANHATDTAEQFLVNLREERFEQAWMMLEPGLRSRWASADFIRAMQNWVSEADNREVLAKREIAKVQRHNKEAQIIFFESAVKGDRGHWIWNLAESNGEWNFTALEGPVASPGAPK